MRCTEHIHAVDCECEHKKKVAESYNDNCTKHNLENWGTWMKKRSEIHKKLNETLNREQGTLLMNASDEFRSVKEEKNVFEYSNINTHFDKYRGNPNFWKTPLGLPEVDPIYFYQPTKEQKNEMPTVEYVGIPDRIALEKDIIPRTRNIFTLWNNGTYRLEKLKKIASKINLIEPHRPEHKDLIVVGQKIILKEPPVNNLTPLSKNDDLLTEKSSRTFDVDIDTDAVEAKPKPRSFIINDMNILYQEALGNCTRIRILFHHQINSKVPSKAEIKFENNGSTTLRFYLNKCEKFKLFKDINPRNLNEINQFFFDKNVLILIPGATFHLPVWFKSTIPGTYSESWEIKTLPRVVNYDYRIIISLQGLAEVENFQEKRITLTAMLENRVKNHTINMLLEEILSNLKYRNVPVTKQLFTEEQLFGSVNKDLTVFDNRAKYLYNKKVVEELKEFYKIVKQDEHAENWSYSITELKKITRERDIIAYAETMMVERNKARERRAEQEAILLKEAELLRTRTGRSKAKDQKSVKSGSTKTKEKKAKKEKKSSKGSKKSKKSKKTPNVVKVVEETLLELHETYNSKLQLILEKLERPVMIKNVDRQKYLNAFFIFRANFTRLCYDLFDLNKSYSNTSSRHYPINTTFSVIPERLIYEKFDDTCIDKMKRIVNVPSKTDFPCQEKPDNIKKIPVEDTHKIYKTYFKKAEPEKVKTKSSKTDDVKAKKSRSNTSKKTTAKPPTPVVVSNIKEGFDPYAEEFEISTGTISKVSSETIGSSMESESFVFNSNTETYNYLLYLNMYTCLEKCVEDLVDMLETCPEEIVSNEELHELKKFKADENICVFAVPGETVSESIKTTEDLVEEIEESVIVKDESLAIRVAEDKLYFESLLEKHWKQNENTKKYLVQGFTNVKVEEEEESPKVEVKENMFEPYVRKVVEYVVGYEPVEVQTDDVEEDDKSISNNSLTLEKSEKSLDNHVDKYSIAGETSSHTIFYFMGDD